jgi:hypothetical protein
MLRETGRRDEADILYLAVPDIIAAHAALRDRGASLTGAPQMIHKHPDGAEEWMAFFTDTNAATCTAQHHPLNPRRRGLPGRIARPRQPAAGNATAPAS